MSTNHLSHKQGGAHTCFCVESSRLLKWPAHWVSQKVYLEFTIITKLSHTNADADQRAEAQF